MAPMSRAGLMAACVLTCIGFELVWSAGQVLVASSAQDRPQPAPDLYHWVLPVNESGVEVATLHPNDCYVVQQAQGNGYFGVPTAVLRQYQNQLASSFAHSVDDDLSPLECTEGSCLDLRQIIDALELELESVNSRQVRNVAHRPSPVDAFFGGAYTDVGSSDRGRFRNAPEQRMVFQHLATARRDNCYEAKLPRTLTIHVRGHGRQAARSGIYQGFLYIEHHHPQIAGQTTAD